MGGDFAANVLVDNGVNEYELLAPFDGYRDVETIKWFSKGYYNVMERDDGKLQMSNLRFGSTSDRYEKSEDFLFAFTVEEMPDGSVMVTGRRERGPNDENAFKSPIRISFSLARVIPV